MTSFDTNIVIHAANADSDFHESARAFLGQMGSQTDVIVAELMLVEVFLKLCNAKIFRRPFTPREAGEWCQRLRANRNWRIVDGAFVMADVWPRVGARGFPFRRIIDLRLGLTLRHHGVTHFATVNTKDFAGLGFVRVWNPLQT